MKKSKTVPSNRGKPAPKTTAGRGATSVTRKVGPVASAKGMKGPTVSKQNASLGRKQTGPSSAFTVQSSKAFDMSGSGSKGRAKLPKGKG